MSLWGFANKMKFRKVNRKFQNQFLNISNMSETSEIRENPPLPSRVSLFPVFPYVSLFPNH